MAGKATRFEMRDASFRIGGCCQRKLARDETHKLPNEIADIAPEKVSHILAFLVIWINSDHFLKYLRLHALRPRVVRYCECRTAACCGMVIHPELDEQAWVRVVERGLSSTSKAPFASCGLRVCDDPMNCLLPIDIRRMFRGAAQSACHRLGKEAEDTERQDQHGQRTPILLRRNPPARAKAGDRPLHKPETQIQQNETAHKAEEQSAHNVFERT